MSWLATGRWFSSGTAVFSANKTDRHDKTEILLKVAWNIINLKKNRIFTSIVGAVVIVDLQLPVQSVPITTQSWEFESRSWWDVLDTTLCDKVSD